MFVATRGAGAGPDLNQLAANAMQYDEALANGRPTLVEFYADWCVVCREMAKEIYRAEQVGRSQENWICELYVSILSLFLGRWRLPFICKREGRPCSPFLFSEGIWRQRRKELLPEGSFPQ
jgi:thiol-disulfide isomerase/thioredoxin